MTHLARLTDLRLNALAGLQMAVGLGSTLVVMVTLGTGPEGDAYAIGQLVVLTLAPLMLLPVEQAVPAHVTRAATEPEAAERQTGGLLTVAVCWGGVVALLLVLGSGLLVAAAGTGHDPQRAATARAVLVAFIPSLVVTPLGHVLRGRLQAAGRYGLAQVLAALPSLGVLATAGGLLLWGRIDGVSLAWGCSAGAVAQLAGLVWQTSRVIPGLRARHPAADTWAVVRASVAMRGAHALHSFGSNWLITMAVGGLPAGSAAAYAYARRAVEAVSGIAGGPAGGILTVATAAGLAAADRPALDRLRHRFVATTLGLLTVLVVTAWLLIPVVLPWISGGRLAPTEAVLIASLVVLGACWQAIILLEAPAVAVLVAAARSRTVAVINLVFLAGFACWSGLLVPWWGAGGLAVAGMLAQVVSLLLFTAAARSGLPPKPTTSP